MEGSSLLHLIATISNLGENIREHSTSERKAGALALAEKRASHNVCGYLCFERLPHCLRDAAEWGRRGFVSYSQNEP